MNLRPLAASLSLVLPLAAGCVSEAPLRPAPVEENQPRLPLDRLTRLDELLEPIRAEHGVPALAAAIVYRDRLVALGATGTRALERPAPVTAGDRWHLGSCTKSMTATVLGVLAERGVLTFDATLGEVFADWRSQMHEAWRPVTLAQLLRHEGGAPPVFTPEIWQRMRQADPSVPVAELRAEVARALLQAGPVYPPGQRMLYSNAGYLLVGAAMERATGRSWEELMRELLFAPLGMEDAGFGAPGTPGVETPDQPWGHFPGPDGLQPLPPGPAADNPPAMGPAGTVHATLEDWGRYVSLHLGALPEGLVVGRETLRTLQRPGRNGYASGWGVVRRPWSKGPVLTHKGSNTAWFCAVWAAPHEQFAVLAVCNQGGQTGDAATDAAAARAIALFWEGR